MVDGYKADACGESCTLQPGEGQGSCTPSPAATRARCSCRSTATAATGRGPKPPATRSRTRWAWSASANITPDFKTIRDQIGKEELKGIFRSGWVMDYPSIENFLAPIYGTGAGSNDTGYSNKEFDAKLVEAAVRSDRRTRRTRCTRRPRPSCAEDFPTMPACGTTWTSRGYSNKVTDVKLDPFGKLDTVAIKVK